MKNIKNNQNTKTMVPYVLPFALYILLTQIPMEFPDFYPELYSGCVIIMGLVLVFLLYRKGLFRIHYNITAGIIFGILGVILWIFICHLNLEKHIFTYLPEWLQPSPRAAFNPFEAISSSSGQWGFIAMRITGIAIIVPLAEELFWRGFLLRWIIASQWMDVEIGKFTLKSFLWVTFLFTLAHPEWIAAAVYCSLMNFLIYWKRDLWNCMVAHSTTNLLLSIYVIFTSTWELW